MEEAGRRALTEYRQIGACERCQLTTEQHNQIIQDCCDNIITPAELRRRLKCSPGCTSSGQRSRSQSQPSSQHKQVSTTSSSRSEDKSTGRNKVEKKKASFKEENGEFAKKRRKSSGGEKTEYYETSEELKEDVIMLPSDPEDETEDSGTYHNDAAPVPVTANGKPTSSKDSSTDRKSIPSGKYSLVFLHIEYLRTNENESPQITQIGCTAWPSGDTFFRAVTPKILPKLINNYRLSGDLLKALHLTEAINGKYQFRAELAIVEEENMIYSVDEEEALKDLLHFLHNESIENPCIIVGLDEDTISNLEKKLKKQLLQSESGKLQLKNIVIGFSHWRRILKYQDVPDYKKIDLEEYYSRNLLIDLPSFQTAKNVANVLFQATKHIMHEKTLCDLHLLSKRFELIEKPKEFLVVKEGGEKLEIEIVSSWRPTATFTAVRTEQVSVSSESEDFDIEEVTNKTKDQDKKEQDLRDECHNLGQQILSSLSYIKKFAVPNGGGEILANLKKKLKEATSVKEDYESLLKHREGKRNNNQDKNNGRYQANKSNIEEQSEWTITRPGKVKCAFCNSILILAAGNIQKHLNKSHFNRQNSPPNFLCKGCREFSSRSPYKASMHSTECRGLPRKNKKKKSGNPPQQSHDRSIASRRKQRSSQEEDSRVARCNWCLRTRRRSLGCQTYICDCNNHMDPFIFLPGMQIHAEDNYDRYTRSNAISWLKSHISKNFQISSGMCKTIS